MQSSRSAVRQMFIDETDSLDEINLPLLADEITARVQADPELLASFLEETLRPMVYEVGFSLIASQRASSVRLQQTASVVASVMRDPGPNAGPAMRGRLLAPSRRASGFNWLRQPVMIARGRQIRLETARQHELELAIENINQRLGPPRHRRAYYTLIHDALPDPDQTVGEVLTDEGLGRLWSQAGEVVARIEAVDRQAARLAADRRAAEPTNGVPAPDPDQS